MCDAIEWNRSVSVRTFIYRLQTISFSWVIHVSGIFLAKFFAGDIFKLFGIVFRFPSMLLWSILVQQFLKELWGELLSFFSLRRNERNSTRCVLFTYVYFETKYIAQIICYPQIVVQRKKYRSNFQLNSAIQTEQLLYKVFVSNRM